MRRAPAKKPTVIKCGTCRAVVAGDPRWLPFCSERCQLVDLGKWLAEEYRVPVDEALAAAAGDDEG